MRGLAVPMDGPHPLGETGKRAAERAQRAETPCKNPACGIRQRYQSFGVHAAATGFAPLGVAETGGNRRKLPAETLLEKRSAVLLSQPRGAPQPADWRN